ncbi:MAG: hypothetical protein KC586_08205, partial [Myxococcales bacterium]|nr:hypothetical protein [Myxococcales bacterium]
MTRFVSFSCLLVFALACDRGDAATTRPIDVDEATDGTSRAEQTEAQVDEGTGHDDGEDEQDDEEASANSAPPPTPATTRPTHGFACRAPAIPIPRPRECERGATYPECKWQMPAAPLSAGRYRRWRNTIVEHWWGRPALVTFILSSLDEYERLHPDQVVAVGDLDAPGPRHQTHDRGVDVDLYVLGALLTENAGGGRYPSNYEGKTDDEIEALRLRVLDLAKVLAACANGAVRIYYNDEVVLERFHAWYDAQGFAENPFGRPMQRHNSLHDFHFHVTIE